MCGRFTQRYTWSEVLEFLRVFGPPRDLQPHYNIAPTMTVDVIRLGTHGKRELVPMRWGIIPAWWPKSVLEGEVGDDLLQGLRLATKVHHLVGGRGARPVAGEPPFTGLKELLRPAIVPR